MTKPTAPSVKYPVGARVVVQNFHSEIDGKPGTVIKTNGLIWPYRVRLDWDSEFEEGRLFSEDELAPEPIKVEDTYRFQPGDKVVYTPPETYGGYPGVDLAVQGLIGKTGTVVEQIHAETVIVDFGTPGKLASTAAQFLARAPEPTHAFGEGLYRNGFGDRVFVRHEDKPERYHVTYLDDRHYKTDVPFVNTYLSERVVETYTLIAEAPRS